MRTEPQKTQKGRKELRRQNKFKKYDPEDYKDCLLGKQKRVTTGLFELNGFRWEDGLQHYISKHNIQPSDDFQDLIFRYMTGPAVVDQKRITKFGAVTLTKSNKQYLKIDRNQILIMDALMTH